MVAVPSEGGGVTPLSVTVPGSTVTVQLNKMKLREADMLTMLAANLAGDPPPPVDKSSKKMSPSSVLVNMTKKNFLFAMGL